MRQSGIYKITNPNGQAYIGQSVEIERRWKTYRNYGCHGQTLLYESLKQHGSEAHQYVVLEECYCDDLDKRETYHKQQFVNEYGWKKALFATLNDPPTRAQKKAYNKRATPIKQTEPEIEYEWVEKPIIIPDKIIKQGANEMMCWLMQTGKYESYCYQRIREGTFNYVS